MGRENEVAVVALEEFYPKDIWETPMEDVELRDGAIFIIISHYKASLNQRVSCFALQGSIF